MNVKPIVLSDEKNNFLDNYLKDYCRVFPFSGVIRITEKDKVIYEKAIGYENFELKKEFSNSSMFTYYSISKPFCALGMMKLYDKGLVDIDKHPSVYVPEMSGFDCNLTIRHLLHHTSGLPDFEQTPLYKEKYYDKELPIREELLRLKEITKGIAPGKEFKYQNINFICAALIIENVSGIEYSEYMRKEIFDPLEMKTAVIDRKGLEIPNRVQGYDFDGNIFYPVKKSTRWMFGAGDIVGTADDLYKLNIAIKKRRILKDSTWDTVLSPFSVSGAFGIGCMVFDWHGKKRIQHNGGHSGFRTLHVQLPEDDFDIILLSNYGGGNAREDFSEAIYAARYGLPEEIAEQHKMDSGYIGEVNEPKKISNEILLRNYYKYRR